MKQGGGVWDMSDRGIDKIVWPTDVHPEVKTVYFRRNALTTLPLGDLVRSFPGLQELSFRENRLETIEDDEEACALWSTWQSSCQKLSLSQNRLTSVPARLFSILSPSLTVLSLANNRLTQLPDAIGLCSLLMALDVSGNQLGTLPASLAQCGRLTLLSAQQNQIEEVPALLLTSCTKLRILHLSHNHLSHLRVISSPEAVYLPALEELHMSCNRLVEVPSFLFGKNGPTGLKNLDLHTNRLSSFPSGRQLACAGTLQRLNIAINQLTTLPDALFTSLTQLEWLNANDNQLSRVPEDWSAMKRLKKIGLVQNQLVTLPASLAALPNLARLDVRRNQLTHLSHALRRLRRPDTTLLIHDNPLWAFDGDVAAALPTEAAKMGLQQSLPSLSALMMTQLAKRAPFTAKEEKWMMQRLSPLITCHMQSARQQCAHCKTWFFTQAAGVVKRQEWMSQDPDAAEGQPSVISVRVPFLYLTCRPNCMGGTMEEESRGRHLATTPTTQPLRARARSTASDTARHPTESLMSTASRGRMTVLAARGDFVTSSAGAAARPQRFVARPDTIVPLVSESSEANVL